MQLPIHIRPDDPSPAYQQIETEIRSLIGRGVLAAGDRLPTTRDLAGQLGVNRSTVVAAYRALAGAGITAATVGRGTFVAGGAGARLGSSAPPPADPSPAAASPAGAAVTTAPEPAPLPRLSLAIESAVRHAPHEPDPAIDHPSAVDFGALAPDETLFPVDELEGLVSLLLRERGRELLQYGPAQGDLELRELVAGQLRQAGIGLVTDQIVIVNGIQQGIDLALRLLIDPGDAVVVESPTYVTVLPSLGLYRAEIVEVPMTRRGIDVDHLEHVVSRRRPKLIYSMPNFQNPTGITMDIDTRRRLVQLAARHGIPILEDDYERDLRFAGTPLPALMALDRTGLVFYMGTFSKGLFPGLRIGWIAAPPPFIPYLNLAKRVTDLQTGSLIQAAVAQFCARGHYRKHVEKLQRIYRERQRVLLAAIEREFPRGVEWTRPDGGFVLWITLPPALRADDVLREARADGVVATPGRCFFHGNQGERQIRLSFARTDCSAIERGIQILGRAIRRQLAGGPGPATTRRAARAMPQL